MRRALLALSLGVALLVAVWGLLRVVAAPRWEAAASVALGSQRLAEADEQLGRARWLRDSASARLRHAQILAQRGHVDHLERVLDTIDPTDYQGLEALEVRRLEARSLELEERYEALQGIERDLAELEDGSERRRAFEWSLQRALASVETGELGLLDEGIARYEEGVDRAHAQGRALDVARGLEGLGAVYWWHRRQRHRPMDEFYRPAIELYRELGDELGVARTLAKMSLVHLNRNQSKEGTALLEEALEIQRRLGASADEVESEIYLGAFFVGMQNLRVGRHHYDRAAELATAIGFASGLERVEALVPDLDMRLGDYGRCASGLEALLEKLPPGSGREWRHRELLGNCLVHLGRTSEAQQHYERAMQIAEDGGSRDPQFRTRIWNMLSHTYMRQGDLAGAEQALMRAQEYFRESQQVADLVGTLLLWADLYDQRGEPERALGVLAEAAELQTRTFHLADTYFWDQRYWQVFRRLFDLLFSESSQLERAATDQADALVYRFLEQMRYRSFRSLLIGEPEALRAAARVAGLPQPLDGLDATADYYGELEDRLLREVLSRREYEQVLSGRPAALDEVRRELGPGTALVQYILASERTFALVVRHDRTHSIQLPVLRGELSDWIRLFRTQLFQEGEIVRAGRPPGGAASVADWQPLSERLRSVLIEPLETTGALEGIERIGIVPFGVLHDLSFAALSRPASATATGPAFLIEDYELFRAPSATRWLSSRRSARAARGPRVAVGVSSSDTVQEGKGLEVLPLAEVEARSVAGLVEGRALIGSAAEEGAVKRALAGAELIHFAVHSAVEPRVPLAGRLHLMRDASSDGQLTVPEILTLELDAQLVTLAGCETGMSFPPTVLPATDSDRTGMIEAFLQAGARNVIASLHPVSDRLSVALMEAFYRELDGGEELGDIVGALHRARLDARRSDDPATSHPGHWGAFVVVGG